MSTYEGTLIGHFQGHLSVQYTYLTLHQSNIECRNQRSFLYFMYIVYTRKTIRYGIALYTDFTEGKAKTP